MEIAYPIIIVISIPILIFLILKKFRKDNLYLKGKKVANAKYAQETEYYKKLLNKYRVLTKTIKSVCIICIILSVILTARIIKINRIDQETHNRDIYLCMDVSSSVDKLNLELVECLKDIVSNLHGERFGISMFNTSTVTLSPLTEDYDFINELLDELHKSFNVSLLNEDYDLYYGSYLYNGTLVGNEERGSSLIGDGLASCVLSFPDLDSKRSRVIIFSTDNDVAGQEIYTLSEAANLAKEKGIVVYGIAPKSINTKDKLTMKNAVEKTGGKYFTATTDATVKEIVSEIEKMEKSEGRNKTVVKIVDYPEVPFILLVISIFILYILNKKVNL